MMTDFDNAKVSIVLLHTADLPYGRGAFDDCLDAALAQDLLPCEVLIADARGAAAPHDFQTEGETPVVHVPGKFRNRAEMFNAAWRKARGELVLLVCNDRAQVRLRQSAVRTLVMAATRGEPGEPEPVGLVYADYARIGAGGATEEVHLLDWHAGRLRDTVDLGSVFMLPKSVLQEIAGLDETCQAAEWYDLRLRVSEGRRLVHVANRFAGALYEVEAPGKAHNVFDYLLADKDAQLEAERVCTEHLKRIGAYLAPGAHVQKVPQAGAESAAGTCVASVVIPVNNRPEFIGRAIESVQAQTVRNVEAIVVVNGGEDDPTAAEVRRYLEGGDKYDAQAPAVRLIVVDVNNLGVCLNTGLAEARGRYYVQLDSDDRLKPDAVEKLLAVFESDPTIGMVVGSYEVWTLGSGGRLTRNEEIPVVTHDEWTADNGRNNLLRINGAGAPRSAHIDVIRAAGWFGVNDTPHCRNYGEDYDLVLRISERYTIGRVWDPIYEVIRHSGGTDHAIDQVTIDRNDNAKDDMRRAALRRRRSLNHGVRG